MADELKAEESTEIINTLEYQPNTPLWKRVPTTDSDGTYLSDFMMIIPRLKKRSSSYRSKTLDAVIDVLQRYEGIVVFADLNMKLNVLWVSLRPVEGMCLEVAAAIKVAVPEALLVADNRSNRSRE